MNFRRTYSPNETVYIVCNTALTFAFGCWSFATLFVGEKYSDEYTTALYGCFRLLYPMLLAVFGYLTSRSVLQIFSPTCNQRRCYVFILAATLSGYAAGFLIACFLRALFLDALVIFAVTMLVGSGLKGFFMSADSEPGSEDQEETPPVE